MIININYNLICITQKFSNFRNINLENRLDETLKHYAKHKVLIIDEIVYLPTSLEGDNLLFLPIAREKRNTNNIYNKQNIGERHEIFQDSVILAEKLEQILYHAKVIKIVRDSNRLKESENKYLKK